MTYFSEREQGERPRDNQDITEVAWGGIQALVRAGVEDGSFGATYPDTCSDGAGPVGTDASSFWQAMRAENPNLKEPPRYYAWERLKTLGTGADKRAQITDLLDATAGTGSAKFREALEWEARELTRIGSNLRIRHAETSQDRLSKPEHVDYLFHRLLSLVQLLLRASGQAWRVGSSLSDAAS
jgi:hypothetical protein